MRRARLPAAMMAAALVAGACGIPSDPEPRAISEDAIPPALAATSVPVAPTSAATDAFIYVVETIGDQQRLRAHAVILPQDVDPLRGRLEELLRPRELPQGLSNSIPDEVELVGVTLEDGLATIELSEEFAELTAPTLRLAVAQLVFTAAPPADRVRLVVDGEVRQVPAEADTSAEIVSRDEYADLAPS